MATAHRATGDDPAADPAGGQLVGVVEALLVDLHMQATAPVDLDCDLVADLALDSLALVELHDRVEQCFGVVLGESVLSNSRLSEWLAAVEQAGSARATGPPAPSARARERTERSAAHAARWPTGAETVTEALDWHAKTHPDRLVIHLVGEAAGAGEAELSYGQLRHEALAVATGIRASEVEPGARVALMLPTGRSYFTVFVGTMLAGCVPVPIYPPVSMATLGEHLARQSRLLRNAGATMLVTVPEAMLAATLVRAQVPSMRAVTTPEEVIGLGLAPGATGPLPPASPEAIALLQYTSGSTGDPKGVVITHRQLLSNIRSMGEAAAVSSSDVFVSWLPLYHDMGLIGAFLAPLYFGMELVAMSPLAFLARPALWLQAISEFGGTLSAAPNFAYQACVDRIADSDLETIDLSTWRIAFNGSEEVSPATVRQFEQRFAPCGFRHETMCPAYGLAEAGVGLAFTPRGEGPILESIDRGQLEQAGVAVPVAATAEGALTLVSCGVALPGFEIKVVGGNGEELPDRHEGSVLFRGPSATTGYFDNDEANRALVHDGWLATGDLGYVGGGLLFLTGRTKDLIIRAGRNLHPEELEQTLGEVDGVRRDGVAVFAVPDRVRGTERLVVVAETDLEPPEQRSDLEGRLRRASLEILAVGPDEVVLVRPGSVRRTTTGKIRRAATRDAFVAGTLEQRPRPVALQLAHFVLSGAGPAARRLRRSIGDAAFAPYAWCSVAVVGLPLWLAVQLPLTPAARWRLTRLAGQTVRRLLGVSVEIRGERPADDEAAVVVVVNHSSYIDGLLMILASERPAAVVASTDLERQLVIGRFLRRIGCVFVERSRPSAGLTAVDDLTSLLRHGRRVVIFPEGSIVRSPGVRAFHLGAFEAAAAATVPVVPVGIRGSRDVVRPGSYRPHRAGVTVTFGTAITPGEEGGAEGPSRLACAVDLRERAREAVATLCGEPQLGGGGPGR